MSSSFTTHFINDGQRTPVAIECERDIKRAADRLRRIFIRPKYMEMRDVPQSVDLQIYFQTPVYSFFPWAYHNWLVISDETATTTALSCYLDQVNYIFFTDSMVAEKYMNQWASEGHEDWVQRSCLWDGWESLVVPLEAFLLVKPKKEIRHLPPILNQVDCPMISVITPTFQRKKLMEIAYHNLLSTDYPHNRIEWVVVEDNDTFPHVMADSLADFQSKAPEITMKYITLAGRRTIGEKRNIGIGSAAHEIILFMDDDDHYPVTSFRRRVAWLTKGVIGGKAPRITCCSTIALYDLRRGISAVNVPPINLSLSQRISEATLGFYRSVWEERPFPEVSIAEGESWIKGREKEVLEMPPQQMIVAFTHGHNQSSRRLPVSDQPPSCFWGFPKEYLVFIHGLVGVDVE